MSILLQLVGFLWAGLGIWNLFLMDWQDPEAATVNGMAVILNMILFILPGLIVGGMGHNMATKKKQTKASVDFSHD